MLNSKVDMLKPGVIHESFRRELTIYSSQLPMITFLLGFESRELLDHFIDVIFNFNKICRNIFLTILSYRYRLSILMNVDIKISSLSKVL